MAHQHCDGDPIECAVEALQGEYDETRRQRNAIQAAAIVLADDLRDARVERRLVSHLLAILALQFREEDGAGHVRSIWIDTADIARIRTIAEKYTS